MTTFLPFVGLLVGAVLRTVLPYVASGLESVRDAKSWSAWPRFDASYLAALGLAVVVFAVAFLTTPGLFEALRAWGFVPCVALAYSGQDIARQAIKSASRAKGK